jgi:segregation and condensation protein B
MMRPEPLPPLARALECLLFVSGEPLTLKELMKATEAEEADVRDALRAVQERYTTGSGLQVVEIANGFQMGTRSEFAGTIGRLLAPHANRLSKPALETVTIIAYRQPCTQAEIEAIRGVASDAVLKTLLDRELIREAGRKPSPGRPILYATTDAFLHYFGLRALDDLPPLEEDEEAEAAAQTAAQVALTAAGVA